MNRHMNISGVILMTLLLAIMAFMVEGRTVTTRRNLKPNVENRPPAAGDTIRSATDSLRVAGYDKTLSSSKETFFITNHCSLTVNAVNLTFIYYDLQGRMLHSRTETIDCHIPGGETRQISIPSWDRQHLFFYNGSPRPRREATPYTVKHRINYMIASPKRQE